MAEKITGSCLCGAVTLVFNQSEVLSAHHCHCTDCQKATGSGKATIVALPTAALLIRGELRSFQVTGSAGSHVNRCFCPQCGSPLISYVEENPDLRYVKAGCLDHSDWIEISSSFWSRSARRWDAVDDGVLCMPGNPE